MITDDARTTIAHARITGSVGCTYNGTQAQRLYVSTGGIDPRYTMTGWWLITHPDGTTEMREA